MAEYMHKVREMLCSELDKMAQKGKLANTADVQLVDWLTHSIKSIDTIEAMDEAGYGEDGYSNAHGRGRYAKRDSMGRYSRDDGYSRDGYSRDGYSREGYSRGDGYSERYDGRDYSRDGGSSYRGGRYSYADGKEDMMHKMREMMESAPNEQEREKIRRMMEQMKD